MITIIYDDVCMARDPNTARKGFESLQEVLMSTQVESIPDERWFTLMKMVLMQPPDITLQVSRISSLSLIGRMFLTLMPVLSNRKENWSRLEDFTIAVATMASENLRSGRASPLFETTVHTVTNICNVMSISGFSDGPQGVNFCQWISETLLYELEKVGACGGEASMLAAARSSKPK
jgi:hypothetical protein